MAWSTCRGFCLSAFSAAFCFCSCWLDLTRVSLGLITFLDTANLRVFLDFPIMLVF